MKKFYIISAIALFVVLILYGIEYFDNEMADTVVPVKLATCDCDLETPEKAIECYFDAIINSNLCLLNCCYYKNFNHFSFYESSGEELLWDIEGKVVYDKNKMLELRNKKDTASWIQVNDRTYYVREKIKNLTTGEVVDMGVLELYLRKVENDWKIIGHWKQGSP